MKRYFELLPYITEQVIAVLNIIISLGLVVFAMAGILTGNWFWALGILLIPFLLTYSAYVFEKS